jgi:hypothetical protein
MEVLASSGGDYHIKIHIWNRVDNFAWSLEVVYDVAQDEFKASFIHELVNLAKDNPYPILIGGRETSICLGFVMKKGNATFMIIGLSYTMLSLTVWI